MKISQQEADALIADAKRKGLVVSITGISIDALDQTSTPRAKSKRKKPKFVEECCVQVGDVLKFTIAVEMPSRANIEKGWQKRNRMVPVHRKAVSRMFGKHLAKLVPYAEAYHQGKSINIRIIRLGGKKLDRTANLPMACKAIEDAIALLIGADDGAPNWYCSCDQDSGGWVGVRIELERLENE